MKPVFLQYNHKWAHGHNKPEYMFIGLFEESIALTTIDVESILEEIVSEHNWSDKYRGIDYELSTNVPKEWLEKNINMNTNRIERYREQNSIFRNILLKDVVKDVVGKALND